MVVKVAFGVELSLDVQGPVQLRNAMAGEVTKMPVDVAQPHLHLAGLAALQVVFNGHAQLGQVLTVEALGGCGIATAFLQSKELAGFIVAPGYARQNGTTGRTANGLSNIGGGTSDTQGNAQAFPSCPDSSCCRAFKAATQGISQIART